jgi:hypothetical protein
MSRVSDDHEKWIAKHFGGTQTKGSGNTVGHKGDVKIATDSELVECKAQEPTEKPRKPRIVKELEKVADEAYEEGLDPVLAHRYFCPSSPLARVDGYVDVVIRLAKDDARRSEAIRDGA